MQNKIALLDCGSQFAHLLANRIRRLGVYCEILAPETSAKELQIYKGIVISGGPASVNDPNSPRVDTGIYDLGIPVLGVCYGHQLVLKHFGGTLEKGKVGEYGMTSFTVQNNKATLSKLEKKTYQVYASHFDTVTALPEGFEVLGGTPDDPLSATANEEKKIYTLQFHPEVTHSECGMDILDAFVDITGADRDWNMEAFIQEEVASIQEKVGDKKVFMLVSGGVDSTVAYALLERALGPDRIYALFVDTGFMRFQEADHMQEFLKQANIPALHVEDASAEFFSALEGVTEPEQKRKIIGDTFLKVQRRVVQELHMDPNDWLLGQGTIYPDTIESGGTKNADKIKTHHNRVPEIEEMIKQGKVIEPIKELYKDEVRALGRKLGLPDALVDRHPFPGPGLAVRCLCAEGPNGEYKKEGENHLIPIKSVGVQGDERTYRHPMILELNEEKPSWQSLANTSVSITNSNRECNRVLWLLASKHGAKIEEVQILKTTLTPERIQTLQRADDLVNRRMKELDPENLVWQFPVVLVPIDLNNTEEEAIVLRPISSENGMTANFTELDQSKLKDLAQELLQIPGISSVLFDLTNKPPATIEWE